MHSSSKPSQLHSRKESGESHGSYSHSPNSSSFYNLQMYSNPSLKSQTHSQTQSQTQSQTHSSLSISSVNMYQNLQEVPYHPSPPVSRSTSPDLSYPNPPTSHFHNTPTTSSSSSTSDVEYRQVQKNGIIFVDPFSPPLASGSGAGYLTDSYNHCSTSNIQIPQSNRTISNTEPVVQPIYATFGPESIFVTCPFCHFTDSTEVERVIGSKAMSLACFIPLVAFFKKSKWDTRHRCKNCLNVIGVHYP